MGLVLDVSYQRAHQLVGEAKHPPSVRDFARKEWPLRAVRLMP